VLDDELRARLDSLDVRPTIEYVASRLSLTGDHSSVTFELELGNLRRSAIDLARIGNTELERLAAVPVPAPRRLLAEYDPREETR